MKKGFTAALFVFAIALGALFIFLGLGVTVYQLTWYNTKGTAVLIFYIVLVLVGLALLLFGLLRGLKRAPKPTALAAALTGTALVIAILTRLPMLVESFSPSQGLIQTIAIYRSHFVGEVARIYPALVGEWRTASLVYFVLTLLGGAALIFAGLKNFLARR